MSRSHAHGLLTAALAFAVSLVGALPAVAQEAGGESENPHQEFNPHAAASEEAAEKLSGEEAAERESELIGDARQLTFEGRRAGEGYFSEDGTRMVFQSEREPGNPFYQIYLMDLETGDLERVSPGHGKTTCAWIHPDGDRVLFASTQHDPEAREKQREKIDRRESGTDSRYAWDYDPEYEIYAKDLESGEYTRLTDMRGYDAEGSYSPDGSKIVFASNRQAFTGELSEREKERFKIDPSYLMDLYIMDADGSNVRRLTDAAGYDGGPFFSPEGDRICWRRFSPDGATAEVYTMRTDGTDVQRLTDIGAMSWAPFYHPSGDYLVFTTNRHGFGNFELYLVRADGQGQPVRVTYTDGFDGLPVFLPGGERISWTSNRTDDDQSQIFLGTWNDAEARRRLGLESATGQPDEAAALTAAEASTPEFSAADIGRHVDYLTRPELGGRLTGTEGERRATAYVAAYLESLGFEPAGEDGTFYQNFQFPAGSQMTGDNRLVVGDEPLTVDQDWRPLSFSGDGEFQGGPLVFAGYGMKVPASDEQPEYDSYVHLDVADKWVVVLRDLPQDISSERRQHMARYSTPRRKASVARDAGARGVIFVTGPTSQVKDDLIRFDRSASQAGVSIAAISITDEVAGKMFSDAGKDLAEAQKQLDDGSAQMGYPLEGVSISSATIGIERKTGTGRNVLARLPAAEVSRASDQVVMLGAHIDHLGRGGGSNSLATGDEADQIHVGADDNASGVAVMLEIAQHLASQREAGQLDARRDFLVAAWSGEELGLFGSQAFVESFYALYPDAPRGESEAETGDDAAAAHAHGTAADAEPMTEAIAAYMNLDMVGRLREKLVVQGVGSSPGFPAEVQRRNVPVGLSLELDKTSTRLPTDASAFVARGVPILSGFTGAHEDYHTPRDTPEKLNYEGAVKISRLFALIARGLLTSEDAPKFELAEGEQEQEVPRARLMAYLGTIPDYVAGDEPGVKLSGVAEGGPAAKAGVQGDDVIVELAGRTIEDIYDYTYAIEALKIGETVAIVVKRGEERVELEVTPTARD